MNCIQLSSFKFCSNMPCFKIDFWRVNHNINSYEILDKDFVMYEKGNIAMIYKIITMPDKDTVYIVIG